MYWNNPIETVKGPSDILDRAAHNGAHRLYYNPAVDMDSVQRLDYLADICSKANLWLGGKFDADGDFCARLVNINRFAQSLPTEGCVKPILLYYTGSVPYEAATGGTRFLAAEVIPEIKTMPAFISTHARYSSAFEQLEEVTDIDRFRELCNSPGCVVFMRLTDNSADHGINWFEIASENQRVSVYSEESTVQALKDYLQTQPADFKFTPAWFAEYIDWSRYLSDNSW